MLNRLHVAPGISPAMTEERVDNRPWPYFKARTPALA
jgi:hypothetical protein